MTSHSPERGGNKFSQAHYLHFFGTIRVEGRANGVGKTGKADRFVVVFGRQIEADLIEAAFDKQVGQVTNQSRYKRSRSGLGLGCSVRATQVGLVLRRKGWLLYRLYLNLRRAGHSTEWLPSKNKKRDLFSQRGRRASLFTYRNEELARTWADKVKHCPDGFPLRLTKRLSTIRKR